MRQDGMRDLTMQLRKSDEAVIPLQLRQSEVVSVEAGTITINLDGTSISGVRYFSWYTPTANDSVWLLVNGADILVLGVLT